MSKMATKIISQQPSFEPSDWRVAPAEHELVNYDEPKMKYRQYVENIIKPLSATKTRKKTFYTIATNVLCADVITSRESYEPFERDIYLPLEIAICKWSLASIKDPIEERVLDTKVWMINPGFSPKNPVKNCGHYTREHLKNHKIEFDIDSSDVFTEEDLNKVMKEINSFLSADRTVFSLNIKHIRQDLGCLKWLNSKTGYKAKPINVFSLEDLYVVLTKHLSKEGETDGIGQGIARYRMQCFEGYDISVQCEYHQLKAKHEDGDTNNCARGLIIGRTNILIDDVISFSSPLDYQAGH